MQTLKLFRRIGWFVASFLTVSCNRPVLYEPSNCIEQVLAVRLTEDFITLDRFPRTETHIGKMGLPPQASHVDQIRELFELKQDHIEYSFALYATYGTASRIYEIEKSAAPEGTPVYREIDNGTGTRGFQRYTVRPRSDAAGGYSPRNSFTARACVQFRNVVVKIEVNSDSSSASEMKNALENLVEIVGRNTN